MDEPVHPEPRRTLSRRAVLGGIGAAGGLLGAGVLPGVAGAASTTSTTRPPDARTQARTIPFHGRHQAGIADPAPRHATVTAFDVTAADRAGLRTLLDAWTISAERMARGLPAGPNLDVTRPPNDPGEAMGLGPSGLTITVGVGPSLFSGTNGRRFGLTARRPEPLADLPAFAGDALVERWSGGDLIVQACSDDAQVAFHAIHALTVTGAGLARARWTVDGFLGTPRGTESPTPRNLLGFKDGTANPSPAQFDRVVWAGERPSWMRNGTYLVVRRIRLDLAKWDAEALDDQEETIGRVRSTGAPLSGGTEETAPRLRGPGSDAIPANAHIRLAAPAMNDGARILRRGYNYSAGATADGALDAGLLFLAYQRDPREQFVPIQTRLAASDALNDYLTTVGSGVYAVLPGVREGGSYADALLG
ncbi:MAG: iron uptake transporter deferrochelatase/peroxidase subunit [Actinomycetes bacterium]